MNNPDGFLKNTQGLINKTMNVRIFHAKTTIIISMHAKTFYFKSFESLSSTSTIITLAAIQCLYTTYGNTIAPCTFPVVAINYHHVVVTVH